MKFDVRMIVMFENIEVPRMTGESVVRNFVCIKISLDCLHSFT